MGSAVVRAVPMFCWWVLAAPAWAISGGEPDCDPPDGGPPHGDYDECSHPNVAAGLAIGHTTDGDTVVAQGTAFLIGVNDEHAIFLGPAHGVYPYRYPEPGLVLESLLLTLDSQPYTVDPALIGTLIPRNEIPFVPKTYDPTRFVVVDVENDEMAIMHPDFERISGGERTPFDEAWGLIPYDVAIIKVDRQALEAIYGTLPPVAELAPRGYCDDPTIRSDMQGPGAIELVGYGIEMFIPNGVASPSGFMRVGGTEQNDVVAYRVYEGHRKVGHPSLLSCNGGVGYLQTRAAGGMDFGTPGDSGGPILHDGKVIAVFGASSFPRTVMNWGTLVESNLDFICPFVPDQPACAGDQP